MSSPQPQDLSFFLIPNLPSSAYYISSFITEAEEEYLLHKIQSQPQSKWTHLSHRRLQCWPAALTPKGILPTTAPLPAWLEDPIISRLLALRLPDGQKSLFDASPHKRSNHVLINEYPPGTGIVAHEDGPAYAPIVATVSLGGSCVLELSQKAVNGTKFRVFQEPRSLLITTGSVYTDFLHGIQDVAVDEGLDRESIVNWDLLGQETKERIDGQGGKMDRGLRISATIRDVVQVRDLGRLIPGLGGRR